MNESETSKNLTPFLDCLMDKESRSMIQMFALLILTFSKSLLQGLDTVLKMSKKIFVLLMMNSSDPWIFLILSLLTQCNVGPVHFAKITRSSCKTTNEQKNNYFAFKKLTLCSLKLFHFVDSMLGQCIWHRSQDEVTKFRNNSYA